MKIEWLFFKFICQYLNSLKKYDIICFKNFNKTIIAQQKNITSLNKNNNRFEIKKIYLFWLIKYNFFFLTKKF